ncbi:MAG: hypothetical protein FWH18_04055 [Marinilabiliaceae bacterium]|nr:hypothetical protein [Marinilabiliaceae bacterium]
MPEQQNIEYKTSWHEEYLDWICGFANAQGDKIYIGKDKMKNLCIDANIPVPHFSCKGNDFWTIFQKILYNKEDLSKLGLNERQMKAVLYVRKNGKITNKEYQELNDTIDRTALRDIEELMNKNIFKREGDGKKTYYRI